MPIFVANMRKLHLLLLILLLICSAGIYAQVQPTTLDGFGNNPVDQVDPTMRTGMQDSSNVEIISLEPRLRMWKISEELGNIIPVPVDTTTLMFQNTSLNDGIRGEYNHLGNLGSPRLSRTFFDRTQATSSFFLDPYSLFFSRPWEMLFTNSNIPYTNLSYFTNFDKQDGEDRFKAYFSVNATKNLAIGFNFDYLYGRGFYLNQSTAFLKGGFFGSYTGDRYQAHFLYNVFSFKMRENGGITDDRYITNPEQIREGTASFRPSEIPVNLNATWNYNKHFYIHYTHRYNLGFYRDVRQADYRSEGDSMTVESFVPVTSFIHTVRVERSRHQFLSRDNVFQDMPRYIDVDGTSALTRDSTTYIGVKNTVGIALLEGFNRYAKAGLTAFISHKHSEYYLMNDINLPETKFNEEEVFVGGELAKREGHVLHYKALGEIGFAGQAAGQFRVNGDMDLNFRLLNDSVSLVARASFSNTLPAFYFRHYHSRYAWWDNDNMSKEFRSRIEGELNINRLGTHLRAGVENIKNYTYLDATARPAQEGGNIQVLSATVGQDFKLGILHWDNKITWQKSSKESVLPLPDLSIYSNLYLDAVLAKVLTMQLGADVRYFTKYKAPAYSYIIQQFHLQGDDAIDIGGFPVVNVYANFQLKRTRFFVMMSHVNADMGTPNYFTVPHYPLNKMLLRFGLSWNFFD